MMLATIRYGTCAQHAAHNPKFEKMDYWDIPGALQNIEGPAHVVEGRHPVGNRPPTPLT